MSISAAGFRKEVQRGIVLQVQQQARLDVALQPGNVTETVVERADFPPERIKQILANETVAILGYGVQGRSQSLNMKDNGVNVIIGLRKDGRSWDLAQQDGWTPG